MEKVLTDSASRKLTVKWDGERFALIQTQKFTPEIGGCMTVIVLSPWEMAQLQKFAIDEGDYSC